MGWLSAITGLFGSSDSAGRAMETAATGIVNGFDKMFHTDEEKADNDIAKKELFVKFAEIAYDQNSVRAVTRRWLAFLVVGPTILCFILSMIMYSISTDASLHYFEMFKVMIPWAGGVLIFYFGPHLIGAKK